MSQENKEVYGLIWFDEISYLSDAQLNEIKERARLKKKDEVSRK